MTLFTPYSCVAQEFGLSHSCVDQPRAPLNVPSAPHNTYLEFLSAVPLTGWDRLEGSDSSSYVWLLDRWAWKSLRAYPAALGLKEWVFQETGSRNCRPLKSSACGLRSIYFYRGLLVHVITEPTHTQELGTSAHISTGDIVIKLWHLQSPTGGNNGNERMTNGR